MSWLQPDVIIIIIIIIIIIVIIIIIIIIIIIRNKSFLKHLYDLTEKIWYQLGLKHSSLTVPVSILTTRPPGSSIM